MEFSELVKAATDVQASLLSDRPKNKRQPESSKALGRLRWLANSCRHGRQPLTSVRCVDGSTVVHAAALVGAADALQLLRKEYSDLIDWDTR